MKNMNRLTKINLGIAFAILGLSVLIRNTDVTKFSAILILLVYTHHLVRLEELKVQNVLELNESAMAFWYYLRVVFVIAIIIVCIVIFIHFKNLAT